MSVTETIIRSCKPKKVEVFLIKKLWNKNLMDCW